MLWNFLKGVALLACENFYAGGLPLFLVNLFHALLVLCIVALEQLCSFYDIESTKTVDLVLCPVSELRLLLTGS